MQQQNDSNSTEIIDSDLGVAVLLTNKGQKTKELALDFIMSVNSQRKGPIKTTGAYDSVELAMNGACQRSARTSTDPPRFD